MDLVLGLSMTSADVRWVLVEGATAEGATICRDAVDFDTLDDVLCAVGDNRLHAIGVTWTTEVEAAASTLLDALSDRGLGNVIAVSGVEAADALATGIADRGGYEDVAVCIVEPDGVLVTRVDADGATTEPADLTTDEIRATLDEEPPAAVFVLGSAEGIESIASSLEDAGVAPVVTAAEADLALARGAALASAQAVNTLDAPRGGVRWPSMTAALATVMAAAAVTFVVSFSIAVGLSLTPDSTVAQRQAAAEEPAKVATVPSVAQAPPKPLPPTAPPPPPATAPPPPEAPLEAEKKTVAAAPAPEAPPPAPEPPPPAYVPPAPAPVYVPPPQPPRLRDRIIERIPIINRFHEPNPYG